MEWIDIVLQAGMLIACIIGWIYTSRRQKTKEVNDKLDNLCERVSRLEGRLNGFLSK